MNIFKLFQIRRRSLINVICKEIRKGLVHLYHGGNDCGWAGSGNGSGTGDCREGYTENYSTLNLTEFILMRNY